MMLTEKKLPGAPARANGFMKRWKNDRSLYIMLTPVLLYYIIFMYVPMYGAIIAFQDYRPSGGILGSKWVGFKHFVDFFTDPFFARVLCNTLTISITNIFFLFTMPIVLALLLNELGNGWYKKTVQTISYFPHFISIIVICSLIRDFVSETGFVTLFLMKLGLIKEQASLLTKGNMFLPIYVISDIWKELGWESIIYMAALSGISVELYEAAMIDGAGRWKQTVHVTIPSIMPTIIIMLILRVGSVLGLGYEKIILLYNPLIYDKADVISTYVYRQGIQGFNWSYSTAVGLFNSVGNFLLLYATNRISAKYTETSLW